MKHYRYEGGVKYNEFGPPEVDIKLIEFDSVKETKCGYWIVESSLLRYYNIAHTWLKPKFVLKNSRKRFAYPSKEEAMTSFIIRNEKRIFYLRRDLDYALTIKKILNNEKNTPQRTPVLCNR